MRKERERERERVREREKEVVRAERARASVCETRNEIGRARESAVVCLTLLCL